jgi:hypothetical protein
VTTSLEPKFALRDLLCCRSPDPENIARELDRLSHAERMVALQGMQRDQFSQLFGLVNGFAAMTLDALVPTNTAPLQPVRHIGRNSLPLFSSFEKRFYRLDSRAALGGANFQSTSFATGPGYFTASPSAERTEVVIDYNQIPDAAPEGWPALANNERGIGRLVYGGMIDTLRKVSEHISIGAAQKRGQAPSAYFVLCRLSDAAYSGGRLD